MALDEETKQTLKESLDSILQKVLECKKHGHKDSVNVLYDMHGKPQAYCRYCGMFYERSLTQKEVKEIEEFRKLAYQPMTI
jgi:transcription elongation factor Elf1